jgi:hypothetical protein
MSKINFRLFLADLLYLSCFLVISRLFWQILTFFAVQTKIGHYSWTKLASFSSLTNFDQSRPISANID